MGRGALEAVFDLARTVPDLPVLLANHKLARTGSAVTFPKLRFTFEDDLNRRLDEYTGLGARETTPVCSTSRWGGYGTVAVGTVFFPGAGAGTIAGRGTTATAQVSAPAR